MYLISSYTFLNSSKMYNQSMFSWTINQGRNYFFHPCYVLINPQFFFPKSCDTIYVFSKIVLITFCIISDPCRYVKGTWSDCDPKTNMRSRILTLKKGDQNSCEQTKTIQKKCKKGNAPVLLSLCSECLCLSVILSMFLKIRPLLHVHVCHCNISSCILLNSSSLKKDHKKVEMVCMNHTQYKPIFYVL
jgi:hypothetical protein